MDESEIAHVIRLLHEAYTPDKTLDLLRETDVTQMVRKAIAERLAHEQRTGDETIQHQLNKLDSTQRAEYERRRLDGEHPFDILTTLKTRR